jgi:3-hydroxyisobutyrate dehydrogenase
MPEERLGFIGLGAMGLPMAKCLLKAGYRLTVAAHRRPEPARELQALGARLAANPLEVARASDIVITMVPDSPQLEEVVLGPQGLLEGLRPGSVLIDMSTLSPITVTRLAGLLEERGVAMLDAPVSGGPSRAQSCSLTIMVGGPEEAFRRCLPVLQAMGSSVTRVGGTGTGQIVKLCNQIMVGVIMLANVEALTFGVKLGLPADTIRDVVLTATGQNYLLQNWLPQNLLQDRYELGFALELMLKDLHVALQTARAYDVPMPVAGLAQQLYAMAKGLGYGRNDYSAVSQIYQEAANVVIATGQKKHA